MDILNWPLMQENITRRDVDRVIEFLQQEPLPRLTQGDHVREFEREWSEWLGTKHSVFVNSGASANLITMSVLHELFGSRGEVIVPALTWVSDITSVIRAGFDPVFVDIDLKTFGASVEDIKRKITGKTKAIFLTHILGYNALTQELLDLIKSEGIYLIEDACESHGTTFNGQKVGTFGDISNFSFYFAHHMSTIEGGMVSTNNGYIAEILRMLRSHGLTRELRSVENEKLFIQQNPDLSPDFIFAIPGYNVRNTEINAVIGRSQLETLDERNEVRRKNANLFYGNLDSKWFLTDLSFEGSCSYAFILVLNYPDNVLRDRIEKIFRDCGVEFRRGLSGGGNQVRQPYAKKFMIKRGEWNPNDYPNVEHVHFFSWYIGNYPGLDESKILRLCEYLNEAGKGVS